MYFLFSTFLRRSSESRRTAHGTHSDGTGEPTKLVSSSIFCEDIRGVATTDIGRLFVAPNVDRVAEGRGEATLRFGGVIRSCDFAKSMVRQCDGWRAKCFGPRRRFLRTRFLRLGPASYFTRQRRFSGRPLKRRESFHVENVESGACTRCLECVRSRARRTSFGEPSAMEFASLLLLRASAAFRVEAFLLIEVHVGQMHRWRSAQLRATSGGSTLGVAVHYANGSPQRSTD